MIVIHVANCPPGLRGDLSKWLCEVNTGVYIGKISSKVRDELWNRICDNVKQGQATMVYSTNNEQGFDFRVHNTTWVPVDYEGITLMRLPLSENQLNSEVNDSKLGFSKAAQYRRNVQSGKSKKTNQYVMLDIETTGLDENKDKILEIGILKICNQKVVDKFQCFVKQEHPLSEIIKKLTGITDEMLKEQGIAEKEAIEKSLQFIGENTVIGYNIMWDLKFISCSAKKWELNLRIRQVKDILVMARKKISNIQDYKLQTVASFFSLNQKQKHRAVDDCELAYRVYLKLNEIL